MKIKNKCALITGATGGLGTELCKLFAKDCKKLILLARNKEKIDHLEKKLKSLNAQIRIESHILDLSDGKAVKKTIEAIKTSNKNIDILINNAGIGTHGSLFSSNTEDVEKLMDLNLRTPLLLTLGLKELLYASDESYLVNIGTVAERIAMPVMGAYSVSKSGLYMFSRVLAIEGRKNNLKVLHVTLGPMNDKNFDSNLLTKGGLKKNTVFKTAIDKVARKIILGIRDNRRHLTVPFYFSGLICLDRLFGRTLDNFKLRMFKQKIKTNN
ncbi:MAG: SDR family NAD(P)-dependent oxidoreductase [Nanoarchaeota archaeon]|nr:SDR family NAD(P)-dependent oxidoreductase [Nanoarchaeota archaeon]